jgi:hypothetical protein
MLAAQTLPNKFLWRATVMRPTRKANCLLIALLLSSLSFIQGCSGIRTYPNVGDKNLLILTETDSGSFFSKVRTAVDIFRVTSDCKTDYEGTVQLKDTPVEVSIPAGRLNYLVFVFASSGFLSSTSSTITYDALLRPQAGYNYTAKVSYIDDIYNVEMIETHPQKQEDKKIRLKSLQDCGTF